MPNSVNSVSAWRARWRPQMLVGSTHATLGAELSLQLRDNRKIAEIWLNIEWKPLCLMCLLMKKIV